MIERMRTSGPVHLLLLAALAVPHTSGGADPKEGPGDTLDNWRLSLVEERPEQWNVANWNSLRVERMPSAWIVEVECSRGACFTSFGVSGPVGFQEPLEVGVVRVSKTNIQLTFDTSGVVHTACGSDPASGTLQVDLARESESWVLRGCGPERRLHEWAGTSAWLEAARSRAASLVLSALGTSWRNCKPVRPDCGFAFGVFCQESPMGPVTAIPEGEDRWIVHKVGDDPPGELCAGRWWLDVGVRVDMLGKSPDLPERP